MPEYMQVIGEDGGVHFVAPYDDDDDDDDDEVGTVLGMLAHQYPQVGAVLGALKEKKRKKRIKLRKANFRRGELAPGVYAPDQGMLPLPMTGRQGSTFALALQAIMYEGQVQKPYRGERLLVEVVRTGATATGRLLGQIFAGTDLQQADIQAFGLEPIGRADGFGVRLTMTPVAPGTFMRIPVTLSSALAGADTIFCDITLLGRVVH